MITNTELQTGINSLELLSEQALENEKLSRRFDLLPDDEVKLYATIYNDKKHRFIEAKQSLSMFTIDQDAARTAYLSQVVTALDLPQPGTPEDNASLLYESFTLPGTHFTDYTLPVYGLLLEIDNDTGVRFLSQAEFDGKLDGSCTISHRNGSFDVSGEIHSYTKRSIIIRALMGDERSRLILNRTAEISDEVFEELDGVTMREFAEANQDKYADDAVSIGCAKILLNRIEKQQTHAQELEQRADALEAQGIEVRTINQDVRETMLVQNAFNTARVHNADKTEQEAVLRRTTRETSRSADRMGWTHLTDPSLSMNPLNARYNDQASTHIQETLAILWRDQPDVNREALIAGLLALHNVQNPEQVQIELTELALKPSHTVDIAKLSHDIRAGIMAERMVQRIEQRSAPQEGDTLTTIERQLNEQGVYFSALSEGGGMMHPMLSEDPESGEIEVTICPEEGTEADVLNAEATQFLEILADGLPDDSFDDSHFEYPYEEDDLFDSAFVPPPPPQTTTEREHDSEPAPDSEVDLGKMIESDTTSGTESEYGTGSEPESESESESVEEPSLPALYFLMVPAVDAIETANPEIEVEPKLSPIPTVEAINETITTSKPTVRPVPDKEPAHDSSPVLSSERPGQPTLKATAEDTVAPVQTIYPDTSTEPTQKVSSEAPSKPVVPEPVPRTIPVTEKPTLREPVIMPEPVATQSVAPEKKITPRIENKPNDTPLEKPMPLPDSQPMIPVPLEPVSSPFQNTKPSPEQEQRTSSPDGEEKAPLPPVKITPLFVPDGVRLILSDIVPESRHDSVEPTMALHNNDHHDKSYGVSSRETDRATFETPTETPHRESRESFGEITYEDTHNDTRNESHVAQEEHEATDRVTQRITDQERVLEAYQSIQETQAESTKQSASERVQETQVESTKQSASERVQKTQTESTKQSKSEGEQETVVNSQAAQNKKTEAKVVQKASSEYQTVEKNQTESEKQSQSERVQETQAESTKQSASERVQKTQAESTKQSASERVQETQVESAKQSKSEGAQKASDYQSATKSVSNAQKDQQDKRQGQETHAKDQQTQVNKETPTRSQTKKDRKRQSGIHAEAELRTADQKKADTESQEKVSANKVKAASQTRMDVHTATEIELPIHEDKKKEETTVTYVSSSNAFGHQQERGTNEQARRNRDSLLAARTYAKTSNGTSDGNPPTPPQDRRSQKVASRRSRQASPRRAVVRRNASSMALTYTPGVITGTHRLNDALRRNCQEAGITCKILTAQSGRLSEMATCDETDLEAFVKNHANSFSRSLYARWKKLRGADGKLDREPRLILATGEKVSDARRACASVRSSETVPEHVWVL